MILHGQSAIAVFTIEMQIIKTKLFSSYIACSVAPFKLSLKRIRTQSKMQFIPGNLAPLSESATR